jgi:hypothetical protein
MIGNIIKLHFLEDFLTQKQSDNRYSLQQSIDIPVHEISSNSFPP